MFDFELQTKKPAPMKSRKRSTETKAQLNEIITTRGAAAAPIATTTTTAIIKTTTTTTTKTTYISITDDRKKL